MRLEKVGCCYMIIITINNVKYCFDNQRKFTILQACEYLGYRIPYFCYNESLMSMGTCRLCLVEVATSVKPVVACVTLISDGMCIFLKSPIIQKVRESILEFLLLNHPLDCPICDQGGECDLQDQSYRYGSDFGRIEKKSQKEGSDRYISPLIRGILNRCIFCSKCVRFSNKFLNYLGFLGRGSSLGISSYRPIKKPRISFLSGNLVDLCPVGVFMTANTNFKYRSWELKSIKTYDSFDLFGCLTNVFFKKNEIFRILPIKHLGFRVSWIFDLSRFFYDSFKFQRLYFPLIKYKKYFVKKTWFQVIQILRIFLCQGISSSFIGEQTDLETIFLVKKLLNSLGSSFLMMDMGYKPQLVKQDFRHDFFLEQTFLENIQFLLFINLNWRYDLNRLHLWIKEKFYQNFNIRVFNFGKPSHFMYPCYNVGWNLEVIHKFFAGKHSLVKFFMNKKKSIIFCMADFQLKSSRVNLVRLNNTFSCLNALDVGLVQTESIRTIITRSRVIFFLNAHRNRFLNFFTQKIGIFLGFQGSVNSMAMHVILPGVSLVEKTVHMASLFGIFLKFEKILCLQKKQKVDFKVFLLLNRLFLNQHFYFLKLSRSLPDLNSLFLGVLEQRVVVWFLFNDSLIRNNNLLTFSVQSNFFQNSGQLKQYWKTNSFFRKAYNKFV